MAKQPFSAKPNPNPFAGSTPGMSNGGQSTTTPVRHGPTQEGGFEVKPNPDAIRKRAYEIYLARAAKGQSGNQTTDWLQAERELKGKR